MEPVRFGLLACSSVAKRRFLPALKGAAGVCLHRVGSRTAERAAEYAHEFGCPRHGSYEAVLDDPEVEMVYISTPPKLHEEWVFKAAQRGKHVWCEKPAFMDYASAVRAVEACRKAGVRLFEGFVFGQHPQHELARSLIRSGRIGQPKLFQGEFTYPRPAAGDTRLVPALGGGVFHDSAGYPVAAALMQLEALPLSVSCHSTLDCASGVDDSCSMALFFPDNVTALTHAAFGRHYRSRYALLGTVGRIEVQRAFAVPPGMKTTVQLETDTGEESFTVEPADQFRLTLQAVALRVRNPGGEQDWEAALLRQHAVMDAAGRSRQERRTVDMAEYKV